MPDLPTDLTYGKVTGRFLTAVGDGPDAGNLPDAAVPTGLTVKFTPKTATFKTTSPSVTVVSRPITCTVDTDGNLLDPMNVQGVWLIAGLYSVTYSGGSDFVLPAHEIQVTTSHTAVAPLDLTVAMPPGPVLTPTQYTELNGRVTVLESTPGGGAEVDHTHVIADTTGLQEALDSKQPVGSYAVEGHTHASTGGVTSEDITTIDVLTQDAYNALAVKSPTTLYVIQG